jgi:outer membrane protein, multidrug efflux system
VTIEKLAGVRVAQEVGVEALRDASQLARARYDNGLSSYLEILIADQQLFVLELQLAQTRGNQLRAVAQLYRALGGGWQAGPPAEPGTPVTPVPDTAEGPPES